MDGPCLSLWCTSRVRTTFIFLIMVVSCIFACSEVDDGADSEDPQDSTPNTSCIYYHDLESGKQCAFIRTTEDCQSENGFINYLEFTYCSLDGLEALALIILFFWLTFLFVCLGVTAKNFFCPALLTVSKALKMSENVAGVTFLAFGNGAPDVFSAIAAITHSKDGDAGLAIGALFGAAVFITTCVAGTVSMLQPFHVAEVPFLRDAIFNVGVAFWTFYVLYRGEIWTAEAVGFILLYVGYVCVVLVSQAFEKRRTEPRTVEEGAERPQGGPSNDQPHDVTSDVDEENNQLKASLDKLKPEEEHGKNKLKEKCETIGPTSKDDAHKIVDQTSLPDMLKSASKPNTYETFQNMYDSDVIKDLPENLEKDTAETDSLVPQTKITSNFGTMGVADKPAENHESNRAASPVEIISNNPEEFSGGNLEEEPLLPGRRTLSLGYQLRALFRDINPIDTTTWKAKGCVVKCFEIYKCPIKLLLQITIPLVLHDRCTWNKLLNCFQLLIGPLWCVVITQSYDTVLADGFYLWHVMVCLGAVLLILAFCTSKADQPPAYHIAFAFLGFIMSVCWIYAIANEIVNLLRMYGIVFDLSDAILGLTFLAWGNCIGDLVADIAMAKQGAPKMAISACFGGPIFNMLIGIGLACTIATVQNGGIFKLKTDTLQFVLAAGLGISLFTSMFFMIIARFWATRVYAILLYIFYAVFLTLAILTETGTIAW